MGFLAASAVASDGRAEASPTTDSAHATVGHHATQADLCHFHPELCHPEHETTATHDTTNTAPQHGSTDTHPATTATHPTTTETHPATTATHPTTTHPPTTATHPTTETHPATTATHPTTTETHPATTATHPTTTATHPTVTHPTTGTTTGGVLGTTTTSTTTATTTTTTGVLPTETGTPPGGSGNEPGPGNTEAVASGVASGEQRELPFTGVAVLGATFIGLLLVALGFLAHALTGRQRGIPRVEAEGTPELPPVARSRRVTGRRSGILYPRVEHPGWEVAATRRHASPSARLDSELEVLIFDIVEASPPAPPPAHA